MLSTLITSATRRALLVRFFSHPGERFYATQLIRELGLPSAGVQKELARFEASGLVTSQREGNVRFYTVNTAHALYLELKSIVYKTEGFGDVLRESLDAQTWIKVALIYGSVASGRDDAHSDIDLLVIGSGDVATLDRSLSEAERMLGREVNAVILTKEEWHKRVTHKQAFAVSILSGPKIYLVGNDDELR